MNILRTFVLTLLRNSGRTLSLVFGHFFVLLKRFRLQLIFLLVCLFSCYYALFPGYQARALVKNCYLTFQLPPFENQNEHIHSLRSNTTKLLTQLYRKKVAINFLELFQENYRDFPPAYIALHGELKAVAELIRAYPAKTARLETNINLIKESLERLQAGTPAFLSDFSLSFYQYFETQLKLLDSFQCLVRFAQFSIQPQMLLIGRLRGRSPKVAPEGEDLNSKLIPVRQQIIDNFDKFRCELTNLFERMNAQMIKEHAELKMKFPHYNLHSSFATLRLEFDRAFHELLLKLANDKIKSEK